jgi:glycosyltransferase involved in cell wall biosynthesis
MRIGIEAKWYFEGPPSGKRVIRNLVDTMLKIDRENEYVIFLHAKHRDQKFPYPEHEKLKLCYVWAGNNALSNIFVIPFYAGKYKLDAVLYQTFSSPFGKAKKIAYIHDVLFLSNPEYYTGYERLYFSPLKFLTKRSDAIVTVSEEEKKRLLDFDFSHRAEKITVAYHGVESAFKPRDHYTEETLASVKKKFGLPDRFLLFVGRLNLRKNVDNLLRALPLVQDKEIPLVVVGADDWKKSNHARTVEETGMANRIIFTGAIYKELGIVYSLATVFCFPSYAESFGMPPLEAMACGIPVVVSKTTSLPEVCGEAGSYVDPEKPAEIAAAVDKLLSNSQLYSEKKRQGLEQVKKFTWEQASQRILTCIDTAVNGK